MQAKLDQEQESSSMADGKELSPNTMARTIVKVRALDTKARSHKLQENLKLECKGIGNPWQEFQHMG